jgi:hypothetical protein
VSLLSLDFVRVDQTAWTKPRHYFGQAGISDGEAALASAEHPGIADYLLIHVPGTMDHNRAREGVAVRRVQPLEPHRATMSAYIGRTRPIRSGGGRVRVGLVGEAFEPSRMRGVRTPSMSDQMRLHATVSKVHQVEPRCTRGKGEVGDADNISVADAVLVSIQRIERTSKQTGIDPTADTV